MMFFYYHIEACNKKTGVLQIMFSNAFSFKKFVPFEVVLNFIFEICIYSNSNSKMMNFEDILI